MLKKNISNSLKLIKYYEFINYNLIYNNKAINRYKKDNLEISEDKSSKLDQLKKSLNDLKNCKDQFMKNFLRKLDEKQIIEFQKMLVDAKLSSHMWTWSYK